MSVEGYFDTINEQQGEWMDEGMAGRLKISTVLRVPGRLGTNRDNLKYSNFLLAVCSAVGWMMRSDGTVSAVCTSEISIWYADTIFALLLRS